jgi:hypothetical protein
MNLTNNNRRAARQLERSERQEINPTESSSGDCNGKRDAAAPRGHDLKFEIGQATRGSCKVIAQLGNDVIGVDTFDLAKAERRSRFIESLCSQHPGVDCEKANRDLLSLAAVQTEAKDEESEPEVQELLSRMPLYIREQAQAMLESPELMQRILDDIAACGIAGEQELAAAIFLTGISRLLPRPLSAIVQALSSTGKSFTVEAVAKLFPPEAVIHATAISPKALVYMKPGTLCHKFVVAGERRRRQDDETADSTKMIREMQSSGRISQLVTISVNGRFSTERIEQDGPIAYIETTTVSNVFNEDANRSLLLATDERVEQTACIINSQAARYSGAQTFDTETIVQRNHAMQRILPQRSVVIPFAASIADQFNKKRVEARRAFPHLMGMVAASALLHQFRRKIDDEGRIIAEQFDYELAECLCRKSLARLLEGRTSDAAHRFLEWLREWNAEGCFTIAQAALQRGVTKEAVRGWLNELKDIGAVEVYTAHNGSQPAEWRLIATQDDFGIRSSAPTCDNQQPSKPTLAQILSKYRETGAVPSENCEGGGGDDCDCREAPDYVCDDELANVGF